MHLRGLFEFLKTVNPAGIDLLHRNGYLDDKQYASLYGDCEELVKILVTRCKKINDESDGK